MNVGFLPRVLPTTPTGRLSIGRRGPAHAQTQQLQAQPNAAPAIDDATLAAGPRKRRRNATLNVDLRPATDAANPLAALWASILRIAATLRTRVRSVSLPTFSRSAAATPAVEASTSTATASAADASALDAPATRSALANLRASLLQATSAIHGRVAPVTSGARARLAPAMASTRARLAPAGAATQGRLAPAAAAARARFAPLAAATRTRAQAATASGPLARIHLPAALAPIARIDRRVLATIGVLSAAAIYGITVAEPPAAQQIAAAAERPALPAPNADAAKAPTDPALADPFSQKSINTELRALRKAQQPGDQARSLTVLNDGTMGMNIVNNGAAANVMVRGQDIAIEPLAGDPEPGATLDVRRVHGTAITRFLDEAATTHQLPRNQLGSLRLIENEAKPGTFIWIGVWNDPARTTLYADREAQSVGESRPR